MSEETKQAKKPASLIATAIIAGTIGLGGGYVVNDTPVDKIDPIVEHEIAFGSGITGLEAVGMIVPNMEPHIHVKWDANASVKHYNVYVNGKKVNKEPIVIIDSEGRHVAFNKLKINTEYSVTVTSVGIDDVESPQSAPVKVTIK